MNAALSTSQALAERITRAASRQTYTTIRLLADAPRRANAFRAYAYFRWLDDALDAPQGEQSEKLALLRRQQALLEACASGAALAAACPEEQMLLDLARSDRDENSGLQVYLREMMAVMAFDAGRRGRTISQAELNAYTRRLAAAVSEALYYFIGHDDPSPHDEYRYMAVSAAHITHMLRDLYEDSETGYFNIPVEALRQHALAPLSLQEQDLRDWVRSQVRLARLYFAAGRQSLAQVRSWRCRLAGYAYVARFEWVLAVIERDGFCLRRQYKRKSLPAALWMCRALLGSLVNWALDGFARPGLPAEGRLESKR